MAETETTFLAALKEYYRPDKVEELFYKKNPFYQLVKKDLQGAGLPYYRVPLITAPSGGISSQFANAQAGSAANSSGTNEFKVTRLYAYAINQVSDIAIMASQGNINSFIEAQKVTMDSSLNNLSRDISIAMFRDGWGTRGRIAAAAAVTGATLQLESVSDASNFEEGQRLQVNAAKGNAAKAYGSSGLPLIITGVDRDTGVLTFGSNVNDAATGVPTIAAHDWIYIDGDAQTTKTKLTGLDGWLPTTAPGGSDDFFGLNRSIDTQRLAGVRTNAVGANIVEALNAGATRVSSVGGSVSHFFMSFNSYNNLVNTKEGTARIVSHTNDNDVGFKGFEVLTTTGTAMVVPEINCPDDRIYGIQMDQWSLISLGDPTAPIGTGKFGDGLTYRMRDTSDNWELRYRFSGGLACKNPWYNTVISI